MASIVSASARVSNERLSFATKRVFRATVNPETASSVLPNDVAASRCCAATSASAIAPFTFSSRVPQAAGRHVLSDRGLMPSTWTTGHCGGGHVPMGTSRIPPTVPILMTIELGSVRAVFPRPRCFSQRNPRAVRDFSARVGEALRR